MSLDISLSLFKLFYNLNLILYSLNIGNIVKESDSPALLSEKADDFNVITLFDGLAFSKHFTLYKKVYDN